ncbi:hypothetical protein EYZ11_012395 [Aspergillus tanneri]|uniref:Zn(2)-C6 fungal-type domain-containing protein n=1 Tax=Aspergillus tanneri TaxID=1220188 RepID=A0A4S3J0L7_9EURO|nr:uncharacterized protein ATNIH1004_001323 [Aspergillus tanneri]KAA8652419.1 hypothetical protein ATNIH1004_001323 [Aspergillus tanneri]THC88155.1 hypothetical protein EYZ11_012395 [Aspergillus tanneri]
MDTDKRSVPIIFVQRSARRPLSCGLCRTKKLRCDRGHPCANCRLRKSPCVYAGQAKQREQGKPHSTTELSSVTPDVAINKDEVQQRVFNGRKKPRDMSEVFTRLKALEDAVFCTSSNTAPQLSSTPSPIVPSTGSETSRTTTGFGNLLHLANPDHRQSPPDLAVICRCLPTVEHARVLFDHFIHSMHANFGVLHVPWTRTVMEESYYQFAHGETPAATTLLLLLSIFASAAWVWTPSLLQTLRAAPTEAKSAYVAYSRLALGLLDHTVSPSTAALAAISNLTYLHTNAEGLPDKVHLLRAKGLLMARAMRIHCLDSPKSREQRRANGSDAVEVELQRRIWWHMVSSDWLLAFSGGSQECTYIFHRKHMLVQYPRNVDDEFVTPTGEIYDFPRAMPTTMSASIARIQLAELCEEAVNRLPFLGLGPNDGDYEAVLALDVQFQDYLRNLPFFFQLDPTSIQESQFIYQERPYIAWQRLILQFSTHSRLCWLHRRFHLASAVEDRYVYSREAGLRSARMVLDLRRLMDDTAPLVNINPSHLWSVMQHVFHAAILLATDVSLYPTASDVATRQAEVQAASRLLERSAPHVDGIPSVLQTLQATLQERRSRKSAPGTSTTESTSLGSPRPLSTASSHPEVDSRVSGSSSSSTSPPPSMSTVGDGGRQEIGESSWSQLWSEFVHTAPELDLHQWTMLLDDIDDTLGEPLGGQWDGPDHVILGASDCKSPEACGA